MIKPHHQEITGQSLTRSWECGSVVDPLPGRLKALVLILVIMNIFNQLSIFLKAMCSDSSIWHGHLKQTIQLYALSSIKGLSDRARYQSHNDPCWLQCLQGSDRWEVVQPTPHPTSAGSGNFYCFVVCLFVLFNSRSLLFMFQLLYLFSVDQIPRRI